MTIDLFEGVSQSTLSRISYLIQGQTDITVRVNSAGGDLFAALSIFNLLKGKCDVQILGLAASAATIIAMAGKKISAASNSLFMIHSPKAMLINYYDKQSLDKLSNTLAKTEESILQTYRARVENFEMPADDLWLTATEAQSLGFVDEIIGEVPVVMDAGNLFINSIAYEAGKVKGLAERLHPTPKTDAALAQILALIKDQMTSGASGVQNQQLTAEDIKAAQIKKMIDFANRKVV